MKSIEQVQRENEPKWMALPGIVGVGLGEFRGRPCLVVLLERAGAPTGLPREVDGYAVITEVAGRPEALEDDTAR